MKLDIKQNIDVGASVQVSLKTSSTEKQYHGFSTIILSISGSAMRKYNQNITLNVITTQIHKKGPQKNKRWVIFPWG